MKKKYFGTDGIRGEVELPITQPFIFKLAISLLNQKNIKNNNWERYKTIMFFVRKCTF